MQSLAGVALAVACVVLLGTGACTESAPKQLPIKSAYYDPHVYFTFAIDLDKRSEEGFAKGVEKLIAYFSEIFNGLHEIFDASDVANLKLLASWTTPDSFTNNSWANHDATLLVTSDEQPSGHLAVYDISNLPSGPFPLLGEFEPNPAAFVHNVIFDDDGVDRVAISHYGIGFEYVDLQRPSVPVE